MISGSSQSPVLPESAVLSDDKGSYVYVVGKDNKVERRDVTTGTVTPRGIAIASGITGKERVVLYAGGFLNPGETVRPQIQGGNAQLMLRRAMDRAGDRRTADRRSVAVRWSSHRHGMGVTGSARACHACASGRMITT